MMYQVYYQHDVRNENMYIHWECNAPVGACKQIILDGF